MYSIIQFSMNNYSSDNFCKFCFYDSILIVYGQILQFWAPFLPNFHIHQPHLWQLNENKYMEVTYGQKLQLHMYHIHQRL